MNTDELLTRTTIWVALIGYVVGAGALLTAHGSLGRQRFARLAWTAGWIAFLAHVVCAFQFYHGWSHGAAYAETARQTATLLGWDWGGGLFFNYLLALAWLGDLIWWWWCGLRRHGERARWITVLWHAFFFFMVFNATVVFGHGPARWLGVAISLALGFLWWRNRAGL